MVQKPTVKQPAIVAVQRVEPQLKAHEAFTPTQPRINRTMLTGRLREIETIVQGLIEDRAHIVLYSERGRGKTSLANVIIEALRRNGLTVVRYQCEASSTFDSCIRGLARNLPASLLTAPVRTEAMEGCEAALPATSVRPEDVLKLLPRLRLRTLVCVIDEFDRVSDGQTRTMLADTVKQLSDRGVALRFMIIGVSENLEQLVGQHPSIQRNLVAVPLPLMSDEEISAMLAKGADAAGLIFSTDVLATVAMVARGLPYIAQLLGLRVAQAAIKRSARQIEHCDLATAAERLLRETAPGTLRRYGEVTSDGEDGITIAALAHAARAKTDKWGEMVATETAGSVAVGGRQVPAAAWSKLKEFGVVRATDEKLRKFLFADPLLMQYVLLRALGADGKLHPDTSVPGTVLAGSEPINRPKPVESSLL